jgi:glycerophosphoryl diester phosphodiesterase
MKEPLTISALARSVWHDFLRARRAIFLFEFAFKLAEVWLLAPIVAWLLAAVLAGAGHIALSNFDILNFLLTPAGLLYAALFGTIATALLLVEQAGVMGLAAMSGPVERPPTRQIVRAALPNTLRVVQLGAILVLFTALAFLPFILLAALTHTIFLTGHDIYFYLTVRPPVFWVAAGIGALLLAAAIATTTWLYTRWALALPIVIFEKQSPRAALRASRECVRGAGWRIGFILFGWLVGAILLGVALAAGFRLLAAAVLDNAGERPIVPLVLLLLAQATLLATWTFVTVVGLTLLIRRLYLIRSEQLGLRSVDASAAVPGEKKPAPPFNWRLAALSLPLLAVAPVALWADLSRYTAERPRVQVTAHRGHARAAPENTLSAMRKAIESGADYAEMDVQQTAEGVVVLLHDRDLMRVAGVSRRLDELSYAEVRRLDVGSWFDPSFAGERVPTLEEVITLCRGKIRLNIEMKFFGPDRRLVPEVARILREQDFESDCLVTSLNYDALLEVKRHNPRLRTGFTVAHSVGDISRLEVDALSVRAEHLSDELLRAAYRRGLEVHVWNVNDARQMAQQIKRGVNNIITSDPDLAIRVRDEWAGMTGGERLVLAARLLLGLEP